MAEQLSLDQNRMSIIIMDYQIRQLSAFSEKFQNELIAKANMVLAKARHEGIPIIYVEVLRGERTPERKIHPSITPRSGEPVLTKRRTGPFSTTNLDEVLKKQNIETIAIMGIQTGNSVLSTVCWATDIGYKSIIISDCCADEDMEVHNFLIERVLPRRASVITSQEFLREIERASR